MSVDPECPNCGRKSSEKGARRPWMKRCPNPNCVEGFVQVDGRRVQCHTCNGRMFVLDYATPIDCPGWGSYRHPNWSQQPLVSGYEMLVRSRVFFWRGGALVGQAQITSSSAIRWSGIEYKLSVTIGIGFVCLYSDLGTVDCTVSMVPSSLRQLSCLSAAETDDTLETKIPE